MGEVLQERTSTDPQVLDHADRIFATLQGVREDVRSAIITRVFQDEAIQQEFPNGSIRHAAMCGNVVQELLTMKEETPISLLSIGDVTIPEALKPIIQSFLTRKHKHEMELNEEYGMNYDLGAKGATQARQKLLQYFDKHFGFSQHPGLMGQLVTNSSVTPGGMRTLKDIVDATIIGAIKSGKRTRFMYPDNSFGTWHQIVGEATLGRNEHTETHKLPTTQANRLHLSAATVNAFYSEHSQNNHTKEEDTWYITPVGNPSGTAMTPEQLKETCEAIIHNNPSAKIILDCVYVRTLHPEQAQALIAPVLENEQILNRILFMESLSKSHGLCGARVGIYFSENANLFKPPQQTIMSYSAGPGWEKSAFAMAVAESTPEEEEAIQGLHRLWAKERKGLYKYLVGNGKFNELFDEDQSHVDEEQLEATLGLYILIKLKPNVTNQAILLQTGCLGVRTEMASGIYMRFAVGKITKPTYAQYAEAA